MKNIQHIVTGKSHEGIEHIDIPAKKGGFFDLPKEKRCKHPDHEPPMHIHIPQGKGYHHVCPACGAETVLIPQQYSLNAKPDASIEWLKCPHGIDKRQSCGKCNEEKENYLSNLFSKKSLTDAANREPIRRGCPNKGVCFCTGACHEIVGYRNRRIL